MYITDRGSMMSGSSADMAAARRLRQGDSPFLWFRQGDRAYVVRDATTLAEMDRLFTPSRELGRQQGAKQLRALLERAVATGTAQNVK